MIALGEHEDATMAQQKKAKLANELMDNRIMSKNPSSEGWIKVVNYDTVPESEQ